MSICMFAIGFEDNGETVVPDLVWFVVRVVHDEGRDGKVRLGGWQMQRIRRRRNLIS